MESNNDYTKLFLYGATLYLREKFPQDTQKTEHF